MPFALLNHLKPNPENEREGKNMALKSGVKHGIAGLAIAGGLFFLATYGASHGWLPSNISKVLAPKHFEDLPPVEDAKVSNVAPAPYPSTSPASISGAPFLVGIWEWNAQSGMILATGGKQTMRGSIMEKHKVPVKLLRQDDTGLMVAGVIDCAKQIKGGADSCTSGYNLIDIMGDQSAEVAAKANKELKKLGPDYTMKIVGSVGYSRGEDALMGPASLRDDPHSIASTKMFSADGTEQAAHGFVYGASPSEGDWDIGMKWGGDNAIRNNPDPTTFDADAMNIMVEPDYNTAAADYVAGKCEDRREVKTVNGTTKLTGNKVHVCINGVATWTPGDVTVAMKRGGLVKIADSGMYSWMMPSVLIGSGHYLNAHRKEVKELLKASWEGADQIKAYDAALHKAAQISAKVYDDEGDASFHNGDYWYHYFHPVKAKDASPDHLQVSLGGSAVSNYADNLVLFGFDGNANNMAATYSIFRAINLQQYPQQFKDGGETPLPTAKETIDSSYIAEIENEARDAGDTDTGAAAEKSDFSGGGGQVVSGRDYSINFATGSAEPLPDGVATLKTLLDSIAITGLKVQIDGYTDNTGSTSVNTKLSQDRADAVKDWLQSKARKNFPDNRFTDVKGHGPSDPACPANDTASCKAQNRRVHITLLQ